jgi:hypothetical protein
VIADFPDLTAGTGPEPTYPVGAIGQLVTAGVNSIEHGIGLDEAAIKEMAHRGTAWNPHDQRAAHPPELPWPAARPPVGPGGGTTSPGQPSRTI